MTVIQRLHKSLAVLGAVAVIGLGNAGCSSEPNPPPGGTPGRTFVITYAATATGDGVFSQLVYDNGLGTDITVTNPPPAWTIQIQMKDGDTVEITGTGTVTNGELLISASGNDGQGNTVTESDSCTGTGALMTCNLAVGPVTLP